MSKRSAVTVVGIIIAAAAAIHLSLPAARAQMDHGGQMGGMAMRNAPQETPPSLEKVHSGQLPILSMAIEKALKAVEQGDTKTALAELNKAKMMAAEISLALGKLVKPKFANARCPMMGSPIDPNKVTEDLIRDYKGQKVAFCCPGCPAQWDELTDARKAAKLAEAQEAPQKPKAAPQKAEAAPQKANVWTCQMHPQVKRSKPGSCPMCNMRLTPLPAVQDRAGRSR
jgi:hypothetical protein